MKNKNSILSYIIICCMMIFCSNGMFAQGTVGEYPGAGVGFDSGCGYPSAGNSDPGVSDVGLAGNVCGSAFDATFGTWVETATGFDIGGFELNNYDIDLEAVYGIRLFYGPQDQCGTICLDAMLDVTQGTACGNFGPQLNLSSFGYPVPAVYGDDIFGADLISYDDMCPNTEYFAQYQLIVATAVDLTDPDGNFCAMDDALITNAGTLSTVQTLVAPGTRTSLVINSSTFTPVAAADCASPDVLFDFDVDVTSGCDVSFGTISKGLEIELRASLTCGDGSTLDFTTGPLLNDPDCPIGVAVGQPGGTNEFSGQISLGTPDELCAILACDPTASLEVYARHTFCEADDINGDGTGVDEAVLSISIADILAEYGDAGAMCCAQACDEFDNIVLFGSTCNAVTYGIGWQTDAAGTPLGGATEDPNNYTWTVNSPIAGTQLDQIGFFDTDGNGTGDFLGNIITYTADALAQGCDPVAFPTTLDVLCPDGSVAVLNLAAGPVNIAALDVIDLFGLTPLLYPDVANFTVVETPGACGTAATVTITAPDGTECFSDVGTIPATPACDSGITNSEPLDYDETFGDSAADPLVADMSCEMQFTGTVLADCAAVACACPIVTTPIATTEGFCNMGAPTLDQTGLVLDDETLATPAGPGVTVSWWTDAALTAAYDGAPLTYSGAGCDPEMVTLFASIVCDASGDVIAAGQTDITLYPPFDMALLTPTVGDCATAPSLTSTCANYTVTLDGDADDITTVPAPGQSGTNSYTITYTGGEPASGACINEPFTVTYNCPAAGCPAPVATDDMDGVCTGTGTGNLAAWQTALEAANAAVIGDANTNVEPVYSLDPVAPPTTGQVDGVHSGADLCVSETQTTFAYLLCFGDDGMVGTADDSYLLLGTHTLTVYPEVQNPTEAVAACTNTVAAACTDVLGVASGATGGADAANWNVATGVYTAQTGDAAGTIDIEITSGIAGSTCAPLVFTIATPDCPDTGVCGITPAMATNIECNDNGTPTDPTDDTFTFSIMVNGSNTQLGASGTFNDDQGNAGIAYGTTVNYGPYPISGGNITVMYTDVDDALCTGMMMAAAPATCSDQMPTASVNITDPCNCAGAMNIDTDGDGEFDLFYELVTITTSNPVESGIADWTPGTQTANGWTYVGEVPAGSGMYQFETFLNSGETFSTDFSSASANGGAGLTTNTVNGGGCTPCVANIPTVGEWGLIILGLLMSITAIVGIRARREEEATA